MRGITLRESLSPANRLAGYWKRKRRWRFTGRSSSGLADQAGSVLGLLESALFRPQTGYYADLVEMAAASFESLLLNHPFIDGNKRVARPMLAGVTISA